MIREGGDPVHALDAKTFNLMATFLEGGCTGRADRGAGRGG